jgi:hypothetical protein
MGCEDEPKNLCFSNCQFGPICDESEQCLTAYQVAIIDPPQELSEGLASAGWWLLASFLALPKFGGIEGPAFRMPLRRSGCWFFFCCLTIASGFFGS